MPGSYKPSSIFEDRYTDWDFINRIEATIEAIDGELVALVDEPTSDDEAEHRIVVPDFAPEEWRSGRDEWRKEESATQGSATQGSATQGSATQESATRRSDEPTAKEKVRHVHYNFAYDLDLGVRRRIVSLLDRAEARGIDVFGSEAFVTAETARVRGQLVKQGTNAWILRLDRAARLALAREAIKDGFKLVSFDDTSLSFIHRPTHPWKQIFAGAATATIMGMGAGIVTGYIIWGRGLRKRR